MPREAKCATDAECHKGTCDSPTADAEKPGDVRWSWQPDGGTLPVAIDVPAVDELGNSYVCGSNQTNGWESGLMDLASLDQCGLLRWQNPDFKGVTSLLLASQELIFVDPSTNDVAALYRDTGQLLWKVDLTPIASGTDGGGAGCYQVQVSALALSPTGPIYAAGTVMNQCSLTDSLPQPFLAAILPNGTVSWASILPGFVSESFGPGLMVDRQGNSYLREIVSDQQGVEVPGPYIASFDTQGRQRLMLPISTDNPVLALGTDRLIDGITGELWNLDGGSLGALDAGSLLGPTASVVIDGQDDSYIVANSGYFGARLAAFAPDEPNPIWNLPLPSHIDSSNLVLGQNQLFLALAAYCSCPAGTPAPTGQPEALTAVDSTSGAQLWTTTTAPGAYPYPSGTMTLSNTATLILASGGQVTAYFAGQQSPPENAPWSRAGGSYSNQSSSAPPAQPTWPSGGSTP